jgi:hypothetical protein
MTKSKSATTNTTAAPLGQLLFDYKVKSGGKFISQEFQDFSYRMAMALSTPEDRETIGMCMRLAKRKPRALLEQALSFVQDAKAKNKVALFLWKVKQLEKDKQ